MQEAGPAVFGGARLGVGWGGRGALGGWAEGQEVQEEGQAQPAGG